MYGVYQRVDMSVHRHVHDHHTTARTSLRKTIETKHETGYSARTDQGERNNERGRGRTAFLRDATSDHLASGFLNEEGRQTRRKEFVKVTRPEFDHQK